MAMLAPAARRQAETCGRRGRVVASRGCAPCGCTERLLADLLRAVPPGECAVHTAPAAPSPSCTRNRRASMQADEARGEGTRRHTHRARTCMHTPYCLPCA